MLRMFTSVKMQRLRPGLTDLQNNILIPHNGMDHIKLLINSTVFIIKLQL
jgi:hypothetical protein